MNKYARRIDTMVENSMAKSETRGGTGPGSVDYQKKKKQVVRALFNRAMGRRS